jgi:hypothetical protein
MYLLNFNFKRLKYFFSRTIQFQHWYLTSTVLAPWEAEIRRISLWPAQANILPDSISKYK